MINTSNSNNVEDKANILIEALPYIQKFHNKVIVIKYGGSAMLDETLKESVMRDVALLKSVGIHPVIVHGGGNEITKWVELNGMKSEFYNGFRITDSDTMKIVEMVLGGVNKGLVSHMESLGVKAVGLSGKDGSMLRVKKKKVDEVDIGFVGDITKVNTQLINTLLKDDYVPVICPIGLDKNYQMYNINADEAASEIAIALEAEKTCIFNRYRRILFGL
ncbi:acetylglutamate kinase [Miniphocaeibacter halophilus]|uniref:acetylglutamate kinase n=1 Tax=Miniphocaeibacter halophilus TaxID=2931922 RepID=UPI001FB4C788|nr:acetylglutamate kinase [Miniphocaeibacter halophilus]